MDGNVAQNKPERKRGLMRWFAQTESVDSEKYVDLPINERIVNYLLGLSVISWAVLGLLHDPPDSRFTTVRITISGLNLVVGIFILLRMPVKENGSVRLIAAALPSLVIAGFAFKLSPTPIVWPVHAQGLFVAGGLLAAGSFVFLGKSFAILPALRDIVVNGPYRIVRHPAYLGELLMVLACALAKPELINIMPRSSTIIKSQNCGSPLGKT